MESMFVWILVFAGATIGLLGTFLISSERELKKKRGEIEELAARLESAPDSNESSSANSGESEEATELIARNKELQDEVNSLSKRLREAESAREQATVVQEQLSAARLENTELQKGSQQLQDEIATLKTQLDANSNRIDQSADEHHQLATRAGHYEAENTALKEELEHTRRKIQDLESKEGQWAEIQARESALKQQLQRYEAEIADLNRQLASAREALHNEERTKAQLQESENSREQLAAENQRMQREMSGWQERIAAAQREQQQLNAFRHHVEELRVKQAAIVDTNRQFQEALEALARSVETTESPAETAFPQYATAVPQDRKNSFTSASDGSNTIGAPAPCAPDLSDESANTSNAKRRRFGIFPAVVAFAIASSAAARFPL